MSKIRIKTLSPVHIGNGGFLQKGNDFIVVSTPAGESDIYVLSVDKLAQAIGTDADTASQWASAIQKGEAEQFVKVRIQNNYAKYAKRRITNYAQFKGTNGTLKECVHDGNGKPYIPGSSIKGAIRTAVVAALASERIADDLKYKPNQSEWMKVIREMEKSLLGNMGNSAFRHLCTGDAYFDEGAEIALKQINLNITQRDRLLDTSKQQVVEAIAGDEAAEFRLNINAKFFEKLNKPNLQSLRALFSLINQHTRSLVEQEIAYWQEQGDDANRYVDEMEAMLRHINACDTSTQCECVLRLGQGIGWRFITGAWLELIDEDYFYDKIVPICRPNNRVYQDYDFPKSRRIGDETDLFGFVKLTALTE